MRKWLFICAAVIILGGVLFFYVAFNGNPISKLIAKNIVENYIDDVFTGRTFSIGDSGYNFKDSSYYFLYTIYDGDNKWDYSTDVRGAWIPTGVSYSMLQEGSEDQVLTTKFGDEGNKYIKELLQQNNIEITDFSYSVQIPKGLYAEDEEWVPNLKSEVMPELWIDVKDQQQTKEEFAEMVETTQQLLKEHNITFIKTYVSITREYDNTDGKKEGYAPIYYETLYSTSFTNTDDKITIQ